MNDYAAAMTGQVQQVGRRWRVRQPGTIDLHAEMTRLTLATVCQVLFGEDVGRALPVVQCTFAPLGEAVRRRALAGGRVPLGWPTAINRRLRQARDELHGVCDEIVAHRRASGDRREDMLGRLLEAHDEAGSLSDAEVRDQVLIFLLAGHETTSTALTYTLHLLGRHPDEQCRVRAEAVSVAGGRALTAEDVPTLEYTTMVLKEAMRLYPSAPFLGRRASRKTRSAATASQLAPRSCWHPGSLIGIRTSGSGPSTSTRTGSRRPGRRPGIATRGSRLAVDREHASVSTSRCSNR